MTGAAPHDSGAGSATSTAPPIRPTIAGFAATRLVGNLFVRFPYVFIDQIARGLGVEVHTLTVVFGVRELGGVVSPAAGRWVDRGHTGRVIAVGGALAGMSCLLAATAWFPLFVVVMVLGGATKVSVDLAQNAWVGHAVPLSVRGRVIGLIEATWAGAFLVGVPALGWAVDRWGWQAAFVITGPALVLAAALSGGRLRDPRSPTGGNPTGLGDSPPAVHHVRVDARPDRVTAAVWVFAFAQPFAQMLIFAVYATWFRNEIGLSNGRISLITALLGVAELVGTVITVLSTDRLGPIRCGMWGMGLTIPPILGVVAVGESTVAAAALLIVMAVAIEFAFVSVLPVVSELDVTNRGKAVARVFVLIMVSRAVGSAASGTVYDLGGFNATLATAALAAAVASGALWWSRRGVRS
ncbi:MAG: MFS transporter [Microthrixaceae bacterium]|nr:MFS transporter [Microthrixaceae bacterium]